MNTKPHPALAAAEKVLESTRATIVAIEADEHAQTAAEHRAQQAVAAAQRKADALKPYRNALHERRAAALAALALAEDEAIRQLAVALSADTLQLQSDDPITNFERINANVVQLRSMVRGELDTPGNQKYSVHPLIRQALELVPPPDVLDRPVFELGGAVVGVSDWPSRRRAILSKAIPSGDAVTMQ